MMEPVSSPARLPMRLFSPAKINLNLRVGPPTADGFHPLVSWMCTVSLFDTLEFLPTDETSNVAPAISLSCNDPTLPCDASNLVVRCGNLLAERILADRQSSSRSREVESPPGGNAGTTETRSSVPNSVRGKEGNAVFQDLCGVNITLRKRIPTGAGLGGGSSDGATAMLGLNHLWNGAVDASRMAELSAKCGSDLPFFFYGPSSVCTGRGEHVRPTPPPLARWAVLVLPQIAMPTPAVYRRFDALGLGDSKALTDVPDWTDWSQLPARKLLPLLVNDLETPAFDLRPDLRDLRSWIESKVDRPVRMSGSGSSLFTLFDMKEEAEVEASKLSNVDRVTVKCVEVAPVFDRDHSAL